MPIYALDDVEPRIDPTAWLAPTAVLAGDITVGADVGIWFGAVARGDLESVTISARSNIQENAVLHTDRGYPLVIGEGCTIGHAAIVHGCTVGDNCLIGMGATILTGAVIGENCLIGAGSLVTEGKIIPPNSLVVGSPAKVIRTLDEAAIEKLRQSAHNYVAAANRFRHGLALLPERPDHFDPA